jgi:hypothetical protein
MLPSWFELLNHLHERPAPLGKGKNEATRTFRPKLKLKHCFVLANGLAESQQRCQKGFLSEYAWPDVCQEKSRNCRRHQSSMPKSPPQ